MKIIITIIFIICIYFIINKIYVNKSTKFLKKYMALIQHHDDKHKYININGIIHIEELENGSALIHGSINNLPDGLHGLHIHHSGNLSNGCASLGGHYNPFNKDHGSRIIKKNNTIEINYERHVGDLGNISSNNSVSKFSFIDPLIKLDGDTNILGRSIVIHLGVDDLGKTNHVDSKTTGNSGERMACGIICIP